MYVSFRFKETLMNLISDFFSQFDIKRGQNLPSAVTTLPMIESFINPINPPLAYLIIYETFRPANIKIGMTSKLGQI